MNNGITIIGSQAHIVGNSITIQNVQIVNGLQTSESIFNYFSNHSGKNDKRSVLIKLLITNDPDTNKSIIYATNNQTNVNVTALRATDKIQHDIEDILKSHGIYYDRRTNYYHNQGVSENSIISPLTLAAGYICLFFKNPYIATSLKQKFMRDDYKYELVFSPRTDLSVWYPIAFLLKKTDEILTDLRPYVGSKTTRFLKHYRHIILFITVSRLMGTFAFSEKQMINFNLGEYTKEAIEQTIIDLKEVNPDCFNTVKKLSAAFYTACFSHVANKYNITSIQAIATKNRELWSGEMVKNGYALTDEILEKVYAKLPPQPWPVKIHKQVADDLELKDMTVSNAIAYLIYTGKLYDQVYGFVFDNHANIVAEGNHFSHTEQEARAKLAEQRAMREKKFGVESF